ncbi:MAG TPA: DNA translocase FtsK [Bacteroidales bacterium]|nr:DNA translocase FtsK [Bacteroidales bacterium]HQH23916.1 DNA translocase FtsK [Bacteroidales bacterium]HQJ81246.1 DNA translocase FtsK [Bacteroidales bacterium]
MRFVSGILVSGIAIYLLLAFIAYLIWWKADQSIPTADILSGPDVEVKNWSGKSGYYLSFLMISNGFGLGAFFIPMIFGTLGLYLLKFPKIRFWSLTAKFVFATIILSLILAFIFGKADGYLYAGPGGAHGYHFINWLNAFVGKPGTAIILILLTLSYLVFALKVPPSVFSRKKKEMSGQEDITGGGESGKYPAGKKDDGNTGFRINNRTGTDDQVFRDEGVSVLSPATGSLIHDLDRDQPPDPGEKKAGMRITKTEVRDLVPEEELERIMKNYDPRLDLSNYRFPPVSILKDHRSGSAFDNNEVIENKENIIKTLGDYKISIKHISATVGPTVTLYEIIPERGVKLARIKSLEDDIALNLSAMGIRIIAPIPGRGTVGIEVPNKKPEIVSMRSLIASRAFQESRFDIALALGRTITNDPYIVDLTKMPHLLVAGATGQGKSVGLNTIITSILYKKHPAELKFVLIDPKRVELPLYSKIERHYLAKLPGEEDAIITDTQKVINTLYSLCIEMDNRLELLKAAQSRNIKEYNEKFITRRLNPEKGHRYLPYIILVIDEFADLIMTAGREIEGPLGRLAQVARAIGIHLIISTQRPTTNIITGFIKANFPTRIAFRVFSSIDSRTILDVTGADRLVGNGDMLISSGAEPVRVQCAYIDTSEIEELTEYIGSQQGYPDAMHLPEYINDTDGTASEVDMRKKDALFEDAARLVVQYQQGSTSLIQRKLSIGYNRAGRIIDQLEAAGIVGPFEGSKAREVLCMDIMALEQILKNLE